jgi:hypothetical protein
MGATPGADHHGDMDAIMDMPSHRAMFSGFLKAVEWGSVFLAMLLVLTVFAFAIGWGWWVGLIGWLVVGVIAGFLLNMGAVWWALLAVTTLLMAVGGAITMALTGAG